MKIVEGGECENLVVFPIIVPTLPDNTGNAGKPLVLKMSSALIALLAAAGIIVYFFFIRKKEKNKKKKGIYLLLGIIIIVLLIASFSPHLPFSIYGQPGVNNAIVTPTHPFSAVMSGSTKDYRIRFEGSAENSFIWSGVDKSTAIIP